MRILILGAGGFIGSHLARHAKAEGHEVFAICRSGTVPGFTGRVFKWELGQPVPQESLQGIQCAIHLAHDFNGRKGAKLTLDATIDNSMQIQHAGVPKQLFFSSYSAGKHARSLYGKTKLAIEQSFAGHPNMVIVRPGLVLGQGGIYGRIKRFVEISPLVPLPDGGRQKIPVISIERLCQETISLCSSNAIGSKEANLFERELVSLRQLVIDIAHQKKKRVLFLNVPSVFVFTGLQIADFLHLPLPINTDNLKGFLSNQEASHISTLRRSDTYE